jgi:hypothetical protein
LAATGSAFAVKTAAVAVAVACFRRRIRISGLLVLLLLGWRLRKASFSLAFFVSDFQNDFPDFYGRWNFAMVPMPR